MPSLFGGATAAQLVSTFVLAAGCAARGAAHPPPAPPIPRPAAPAPQRAEGEALPAPGSLPELLELADARSPRIAAAHESWEAARERAPQAGAFPDPRVNVRWYAEEVETRVGPQEWAVGLSQTIPLGGQLSLREEVAVERAAATWFRLQDERLAVFREIEDAWLEGVFVERAVEVVRANLELAVDFERVARNLYASGAAGFHDVLRAQVEISVLDDRLRSLEDQRRPILARINAALDRTPDTPVVWSDELPAGADLPDDLYAVQGLSARSTELLALAREVRAAESALELAGVADVPDLTVGLDYISTGGAHASGVDDSGKDPIVVTLGADIPLWRGRYDAVEAEARANVRAARMRQRAALDRLVAEVEQVHYTFRDSRRRIDLYERTIVPRAQQALEATDVAYRAGSADFLDLVDAQEVLLEFDLGLERARADRAQARALLRRLLVDLPAGPSGDRSPLPESSEESR